MTTTTRCYIAFGSNLQDPEAQVQHALQQLDALPGTALLRVSPLYGSTAVGPGEQPDYVNGIAEIDTALAPQPLLEKLQRIESGQGRLRRERWAARTIDLDIVLHGSTVLDAPDLKIPHPRMRDRNFVIVPLHDLAPDLILPDGTLLASLLDSVSGDGLWQLPATANLSTAT